MKALKRNTQPNRVMIKKIPLSNGNGLIKDPFTEMGVSHSISKP